MNPGKYLRLSLATVLSSAVALSPTYAFAQVEPASAPTLRITNGGGSQSATLILPFGKSAIIDLPADARDILISNPEIADATVRTARRAYVIGRALGQTNIFFFDAQGRQIANVEIRVEPDVEPLNSILGRHSPDSQITAEALNGSIILSGTARSAAESDRARQLALQFLQTSGGAGAAAGAGDNRIVNLVQVQGSEQVLVRVRVVEMSRTLVRQLGINLNYENLVNQTIGNDEFLNLATSLGYSINGGSLGGLTGSGGFVENVGQPNERTTDATIQAFERAGLLRVLAEPNLTAISGEAARFLAGGEFPVPVAADDGQISIEFKPFGVGLAFTPVVLSGGRISLKVATEVSELTSEGAISTGDTPIRNPDGSTTVVRGINIPALQVRRAETTLEMSSGSSIVLAGLIQERSRHAMEGAPGMMNSPILGALFRSRDFLNSETELVIIVTPYLVEPTSPERLRTPADGFRNPSEGESLLSGRLNSLYRPSNVGGDDNNAQGLQGPHGHVIE